MKRKTLLLAGFSALLTLASCGSTSSSSSATSSNSVTSSGSAEIEEVTVKDMVGRDVTVVPGSYKKVVCIGAGALRMYSYIGDMDILAGVEDIDNETLSSRPKMFDSVARPYVLANKDKLKTLPSCGVGGPQNQAAEPEKILDCNPDIVISLYEDVDKENALQEQLGVPVITLRQGNDGVFSQTTYDSFTLLGKIFGKENRAKELNDFIQNDINALKEATKNLESEEMAYICGLGNWGTTNQFMTAQNYAPFNVSHIHNVVIDLPKDGIQKIDEEKFVALSADMDKMIFDAAAIKNIRGTGFDFSACKAFQTGEVYLQMAYNAYYTNLELALSNAWYNAKAVYGDAFALDIEKKTNEITKAFNRAELYSQIKECPSSFGGYQKIANPTEFFA